MKTILLLLTLAVCLVFGHNTAFSSDSATTQIVVTLQTYEKPDRPDLPGKGSRIPAAPTVCVIDFSSHHMDVAGISNITSYELWDEDGTTIIVSYDNDHEMVMYLANLSECYQLRLVTDTGAYIGYLYL